MAQIAARVTDEEKELLEQYCKDHDIKISQLVRWAVKDYMTKETKDNEEVYGIQQEDCQRISSTGF